MGRPAENQYMPDTVSPPGETLQETLGALGMSQSDLAERTGRSKKMINEIVKGKAPITPKMSLELERVLGVPASFWNNRERNFREAQARIEEQKRLQAHVEWLNSIPVKVMVKWGWIKGFRDKVPQLQEVLSFFGIASPDQWSTIAASLNRQVVFRKSEAFEVDNGALLAWLRKGELEGKTIRCSPYNEKKFRSCLYAIRELTVELPEIFQERLVDLCADCGVAVVFVPELPKTRVSGATRWLTANKAMIQLSLRYRSNDHLWFSFFHEAGHIIKHGKKMIFLEGNELEMDKEKEEEANHFASDFLIPRQEYAHFVKQGSFSKINIRHFASQLGVAPGIVVGRLQHDKHLPESHCNDLKIGLRWAPTESV
jgi:addiction module HigA family antidote